MLEGIGNGAGCVGSVETVGAGRGRATTPEDSGLAGDGDSAVGLGRAGGESLGGAGATRTGWGGVAGVPMETAVDNGVIWPVGASTGVTVLVAVCCAGGGVGSGSDRDRNNAPSVTAHKIKAVNRTSTQSSVLR